MPHSYQDRVSLLDKHWQSIVKLKKLHSIVVVLTHRLCICLVYAWYNHCHGHTAHVAKPLCCHQSIAIILQCRSDLLLYLVEHNIAVYYWLKWLLPELINLRGVQRVLFWAQLRRLLYTCVQYHSSFPKGAVACREFELIIIAMMILFSIYSLMRPQNMQFVINTYKKAVTHLALYSDTEYMPHMLL